MAGSADAFGAAASTIAGGTSDSDDENGRRVGPLASLADGGRACSPGGSAAIEGTGDAETDDSLGIAGGALGASDSIVTVGATGITAAAAACAAAAVDAAAAVAAPGT
jgi:hypothetical protein